MAPSPQQAAIAAAVHRIIAAQSAPVNAARKQADQTSAGQQERVTGLSKALAAILQGIGPGVESTYSNASAAQSAFAKGFSDQTQQAQASRATNTSDFLSSVVGAPSSQLSEVQSQVNPAATGDTLYGLRGYIPASTLNEEGAAYTANAKQLPAIAYSQGLQQIGKLQAAQTAQDADFDNQLAKIGAQAPALTRQLTNDVFNQAYKTQQAKIAAIKLADSESNTTFNQKATLARLNLDAQKAARLAYQSDRSYALQLSNFGLKSKALQLRALAQEAKLQNGGFTPVQLNRFKTDAGFVIAQAKDAASTPTYQSVMEEMLKRHVPVSLAQASIRAWNPTLQGTPATGLTLKDYNKMTGVTGSGFAPAIGRVSVAPNANRAGAPLSPTVESLVSSIAGVYGHPLTIGTGTNHNEYVLGTHRVSDHWAGNAADIPASGAALTRLGQAALIAMGADPKWARKQKGGLFNLDTPLGRVQIIFNSMEGGNHYNHLHVGLSPRG